MDNVIDIPGSAPLNVPLSHGRRYGDLVFTSGQVARNIMTGEQRLGTIEEETRLVLENIKTVLEAAGSSLDCVLKTTVYLTDKNDFARMNGVYATFFPGAKPGRSAVVISLAGPYKVEIEAIAYIKK